MILFISTVVCGAHEATKKPVAAYLTALIKLSVDLTAVFFKVALTKN